MVEKHFEKILNFYKKAKRMPSYREILQATGLKSKGAAAYVVGRMVEERLVQRDRAGKLIPLRLDALAETRLLGTVEAGWPSPAEEELRDTMSLDEYLIKNKEATYLLKVSGDSMTDAGIMPGDMVLVDRSLSPRDGDVVVAEVDGGWTMKFFKKTGSGVYLMPGNKKYKPIHPTQELKIAAVVIGVIRKYQ